MLDRDDAIALFERRRDAWLNEDFDGYLEFFAEELVLQTPLGEPLHGRRAYAALVRKSYEVVRPVSFDFHEIAVHGSKALAEWTITVEKRADGKRTSYRGMSICEIRDGLIRSWREYYNPFELRDISDGAGRRGDRR